MTTRITAPDARANGSAYIGPTVLDFTDGVATTTVPLRGATRAYLARRGYVVEDLDAPAPAPQAPSPTAGAAPDEPVDHLSDLTVAQLRQYAKDHNINLGSATRKADILSVVTGGEGSEDQ